jgi:predicted lipoprotein
VTVQYAADRGSRRQREQRSASRTCCLLVLLGVACSTPRPDENHRAASADPTDAPGGPEGGGGSRDDAGRRDGGPRDADGSAGVPSMQDAGDASAPVADASTSVPVDGGGGGGDDLGTPDGLRECDAPPTPTGSFTRQVLRAAAADCALHELCEFENAARWLEHYVDAHAEAPTAARLELARQAWRDAMQRWSRLELFQFGPAASNAATAGKDIYQGQSYRDRIYAWPSTARCRVEEQVAGRAYEDGFDRVLISSRGLFALEYLLFYDGDDTACLASSTTAQTWSELSDDALASRKRAYARAVATDVRSLASALHQAWSPSGGNFRAVFVSASGYPDEQEAMNVLGWALAYVDKELKDWKLGVPLGHELSSPVSTAEAPYAHVGTSNLRANLRGFRALFQGCGADGAGVGFDDWLVEAGHGALAADLIDAWQDAQSELDALGPLHQAPDADLERAYQTLRTLTTLMKAELFGAGSPLNLELPATLEGDTD